MSASENRYLCEQRLMPAKCLVEPVHQVQRKWEGINNLVGKYQPESQPGRETPLNHACGRCNTRLSCDCLNLDLFWLLYQSALLKVLSAGNRASSSGQQSGELSRPFAGVTSGKLQPSLAAQRFFSVSLQLSSCRERPIKHRQSNGPDPRIR